MDKPTKTATIGGIEYPLYLNLYATEEIQKKFGNLNVAEKIVKPENISESISVASELVVILANQGIDYENYFAKDNQREHLTVEAVKLLCSPKELNDLRAAVFDAMLDGAARTVESEPSEDTEKNSQDE